MGEAELIPDHRQLIIRADIIIYGDAASEALAVAIAEDISTQWNAAKGRAIINDEDYEVLFSITGQYDPALTDIDVLSNTDPRRNYFRVEEKASGNISFVDDIGSNTGYFQLDNLLHHSTTAAHEFGHTLGLQHPEDLDIRGKGRAGIMYPRGTLVDPMFQYDANIPAGQKGGTLNPHTREVTQEDIDGLNLGELDFNDERKAILGGFTSVWHERYADQA